MRRYVYLLLALLPAALLLWGIHCFFQTSFPYEATGDNLVSAGAFEISERDILEAEQPADAAERKFSSLWKSWGPFTEWHPGDGREGTGAVTLHASGTKRSTRLHYDIHSIPADQPFLLVSLHTRTEWLRTSGNPRRHSATARFGFLDDRGEFVWPGYAERVSDRLHGTTSWQRHYRAFRILPGVSSGRLILKNSGIGGSFSVDDIVVAPSRFRDAHQRWRLALLVLWYAATLTYVIAIRPWKRPHGLIVVALIALVVFSAACPERIIERVHSKLDRVTDAANPADPTRRVISLGSPMTLAMLGGSFRPLHLATVTGWLFRSEKPVENFKNAGHLVCFAFLGWFVFLSLFGLTRRTAVTSGFSDSVFVSIASVAGLAVFGWATEILQLFAISRTVCIYDFAADMLGVGIGMASFAIVRAFARSRPVE